MDRNAELRSQVKRTQSNVRRKIARNVRKGVDVNQTGFNPLRAGEVDSMTKRQLTTYYNQLQRFQSRRNQFVPDANGGAIPSRMWREYKKMERQYNTHVNELFDRSSSLILPNGQSIKDTMIIGHPDNPHMRNQAVNSLYKPRELEPEFVNGMKGMERLLGLAEKRNSPEYFEAKRKDDKKNAKDMLDMIGDEDLSEKAFALSDEQWDVLFNYTEFVTDLVLNYDSALKEKNTGKKRSKGDQDLDSGALENAHRLVDWVKDAV